MYILSATNKLQDGETHLWILGHGVRDLGLGDTVGLLGVVFFEFDPVPSASQHIPPLHRIVSSFFSSFLLGA